MEGLLFHERFKPLTYALSRARVALAHVAGARRSRDRPIISSVARGAGRGRPGAGHARW